VADQLRLRAVFDNVLSNALKYTPGGGHVDIEVHHDVAQNALDMSETMSISITDTGPGIPSGFRSRIFDKFFRLEHHHSEARPAARGAGIGLYMSRQIVELHGGEISCSAGVGGRGTRITVTLPASVRAATSLHNAVTLAS
jgi:NtrC-family two-component system sensor histidine kinase KinB